MSAPAAPRAWWREHGALWAALAIVVVVNLVFDLRLTMLTDEFFSINTAQRSLAGTVRQALDFDMQPPVYFLLLNLWLRLGDSLLWARLFSLLAVVATVIVFDRLGRAQGGGARLLPLFAALSPVLLQAGSYVRGYALAACWTALALWLFWRVILAREPAGPALVAAFVLACAAAMLTFYYSGFVIGAVFLAGLVVRPRSRSLWLASGALALLMLPWAPTVLRQAAQHPDLLPPVDHAGSLAGAIGFVVTAIFDGVLGGVPLLDQALVRPLLVVACVALIACRLASLRRMPWTAEETAWTIIAVVPLAILAAMRYSNAFYVEIRHWGPASLAPLILAVALVARCAVAVPRGALLAAMVIAMLGMSANRLRNLVNWPDLQAALAWMRVTGDDPSRPIIVYRGEYAMMFRYYVPSARVIALPREASLERFPLDDQVIRSEAEVAAVVERAVAPGETFWLVQPVEYRSLGGGFLDGYLGRHAEVLGQRDTALLRVQLLRSRAPAQSLPHAGRSIAPIPRD